MQGVNPRVHIALSVSISMIKPRKIKKGGERKIRKKKRDGMESDLTEHLPLKSLSLGVQ